VVGPAILNKTLPMPTRAERVAVREDPDPFGSFDYATAFEVTRRSGDLRSPEEWIRAVFEGAPTGMKAVVQFGWRYVMWLRLGPGPSPNYVLGWRISNVTPDMISLDVDSPLVSAHKVLRIAGARVLMTTFVRYQGRPGRAIWTAVTPIHHRTEPYLLGHAAGRPVFADPPHV
jgi:Protein of unknown function (DUF2867)